MLNDFTGADKIYIACGYTDLRRGIDGLASIVKQQFSLDPFTNTLFLFCGRRKNRIKGLYWEQDGFVLLYKRLEYGNFQWPRTEEEINLLPVCKRSVLFTPPVECTLADLMLTQSLLKPGQFAKYNDLHIATRKLFCKW